MDKKDKNLLVISSGFAPENAIGAVRISNITRYLCEEFKKVYVISPPIEKGALEDSSLNLNFNNLTILRTKHRFFFRYIRILRSRFLKNRRGSEVIAHGTKPFSAASFFKENISRILFKLFYRLKNRDFFYSALEVFNELSKTETFQVMLTSYPSYSPHQIGLTIKKKYKEIKWIADFRDPMIYKSMNNFNFLHNLQSETLAHADISLAVSKGVKKLLSNSSNNANIKIIYNGFNDPPILKENKKINPKNLNFCYMGSLYGGKRDISIFFKLLDAFIKKNNLSTKDIYFHYAGSDFHALHQQATKYGLRNILVNHGYLSRVESLEIQSRCDFVVIGTWNYEHEQGILTGKIFEAFMLKRPVIAVVTGDLQNSEMKKLLESTDSGFAIETSFFGSNEELDVMNHFAEALNYKTQNPNKVYIAKFKFRVEEFHYKNLCRSITETI